MSLTVITIGIDPEIQLGPVTIAWHGLTIAIGILVGFACAARWVRSRGLDPDPLFALTGLIAIGGIVGGRLFYVVEHGGPLLGTRGFTFDGGFILAGLLVAFGSITSAWPFATWTRSHYGSRLALQLGELATSSTASTTELSVQPSTRFATHTLTP